MRLCTCASCNHEHRAEQVDDRPSYDHYAQREGAPASRGHVDKWVPDRTLASDSGVVVAAEVVVESFTTGESYRATR